MNIVIGEVAQFLFEREYIKNMPNIGALDIVDILKDWDSPERRQFKKFVDCGTIHSQGRTDKKKTTMLNGCIDTEGRDIAEQVFGVVGVIPETSRIRQNEKIVQGCTLGELIRTPVLSGRRVRSMIAENGRVTYFFHDQAETRDWHEFLAEMRQKYPHIEGDKS